MSERKALIAAAILTAASLAAPAASAKDRAPPVPCTPGYATVELSEKVVRVGATVALHYIVRDPPYGVSEPEARCIGTFRSSDPKIAKLSKDGRTLTIAATAPANSSVTVSWVWSGEQQSRVIKIHGKDEIVLVGARSETARSGCLSGDTVGELKLSEDGSFGVTFQPFESYVDYWGTYTFDPATGRLDMKASGGNFIPVGLDLSGTIAVRPDGHWVLTGFNLGGHSSSGGTAPEACVVTF